MTTLLAHPAPGSRDTTHIRAYPLAALQSAMLVNHLRAPHSGVDIVQTVCQLPEVVNVDALRAAWEEVSTRHDVLRTRFRWEGIAEPLQEVVSESPPTVVVLDWSSLDAEGVAAAKRDFLAADRELGFDLRNPPLQRVTLMRERDDYWHMVWTFNHILMDGRSFPMVLREVFAVYEASLRGETVPVKPRKPFSDFVEWYNAQDFSKSEEFWRERLRNIPGPTPIPAAFHDIGQQSKQKRGLHERKLNAASTAALEKLARANGLTMNNIVQGAWSLLLSRHSGESDVVFGATRACRKNTIEGADDVIGLFINTVPVRVTVRNDMPLGQWLGELREGWRMLFDAEHTPLRLIQRWSDAGAQTPLFDTQIVYENLAIDATLQADGGAMAKRGFWLLGGTNFALTALVFGGTELSLEIENERSLIDDDTARRLLDHLASLFESMAAQSDATVGELMMLPARERELVVSEWNDTDKTYPADVTLVSLLRDQALRTPNAVAVVDEKRSLTYAELDERSTRLAHRLRASGVGTNTLVGVCAERSAEMVIALHAAIKAGGAYVPIDPEYPSDRVAFMLEDAGAPVLLAQSHIASTLPPHSSTVILLDDVANAPTDSTDSQLPLPAPDDSAYMIYTSGSTGKPKGARNAHRGIVNRLLWMQDMYNLTSRDVVLQKTPFSFDVSVWEFFWPLITGAKLVMARPGGHKDSGYLSDVMNQHGVTVCHFVPSMLRAFVADTRAKSCTTLRAVMASGEGLPADLVAAFNDTLPAAQLHNLYGPTECAVDVTFWPCPKDIAPTAVVPIGRPVANTQVYVLDEKLQPTAVGVPGELYLAGVQVGQGYHKRAELTAERFVPDTFANNSTSARMYRTGDRARWRPDGTVEYLGRLDFQVKIRGFRIELGEIENALLAHESVHDAVVVAYSDKASTSADSKKLVAYVVGKGGAQSTASLRAALADRLPDYMVPAIFVWLPALPLSSNGKVDRRALPAPEVERDSLSKAFVAPSTREEVFLADIWKQTLKVADVGVEDNFFELGGDSLLGVQILARAASAGLRITLTQLLRTPTVAALARAAAAESLLNGDALRSRTNELRSEVSGLAPLTPVQQWFFENQGDNAHHWNQAFLFSVPSSIDADLLAQAFAAVTTQHDSFRLRFKRDGGNWTQKSQPSNTATDLAFAAHDLRSLAQPDVASQVSTLGNSAQSALNIETGPLLRADLFKLSGDQSRLLITAHHLAVDGVSWRIIREDVERAYGQLTSGSPIVLDQATTPFSAWAHEVARAETLLPLQRDLAYWEKAGAPSTTQLPRDVTDSADTAAHSKTIAVRISESETRDLFQRVPQAYNTQINDVLLTALADSLSQWAGDGEFVVNVEGHGREDIVAGADVSRTTGWFTTIFPVRLKLQSAGLATRLKETKELLRAVPNRGLSYGALRYHDKATSLQQQPSPELVFNYLGQFDQTVQGSSLFAFANEDSGSWYGANTKRPHALELNALVIDGCLELRWSYSTAVHNAATVAGVAEQCAEALRALITHCTQVGVRGYTPSDFPLAQIGQGNLDILVAKYASIENIYPLTPMQELFLGVSGQSGDAGFEQWRYRMNGTLDVAALRTAWNNVVQRHAILRTAFVSEGLARALQVVSAQVQLPFGEVDLRHLHGAQQESALQKFLTDDRAAGFSVDRAPLMHVTLVRLASDAYEFVWSNHHLLLDRWSWPLILQEVEVAYTSLISGKSPSLPAAASYAEFVEWQQQQPEATAREFWTRHFAGFDAPSRFVMSSPNAATDHDAEVVASMPASDFARVQSFARSQQVATNAVIEAAWALCLARRSNHLDVSFGVAVAGRDANIAGIERMVGLTINNLPLRVQLDERAPIAAWLKQVHEAQSEQQQFAHVSLSSIQQWSNVPWRTRLFESLLVFQHDDAEQRTSAWLGGDVTTELQHVPTRTAYPLSIMVAGATHLEFRVTFDARYFSADEAQALANALRDATMSIAAHESSSVGQVLSSLPVLAPSSTNDEAVRAAYVAPRNATESVLARIWSEVLGAETLGMNDDFFRLGGYSLVATQITSRIRTTLKTDAPVRLLFQHPTVATLASALAARDKKPGQLERIAQVVQRVQSMSLDEVRRASEARAVTN